MMPNVDSVDFASLLRQGLCHHLSAAREIWGVTPGTLMPPLLPGSILAHCSPNTSGRGLYQVRCTSPCCIVEMVFDLCLMMANDIIQHIWKRRVHKHNRYSDALVLAGLLKLIAL